MADRAFVVMGARVLLQAATQFGYRLVHVYRTFSGGYDTQPRNCCVAK